MTSAWPPREIPSVPDEITEAANEGNLVLFIGAGVSRLMGGPSWDKFADAALSDLVRQDCVQFGDIEQLRSLDARKRLTIAELIAKGDGIRINYEQILSTENSDSGIYRHIKRIGCAYVTTNYDEHLYSHPGERSDSQENNILPPTPERICNPEQFLAGRLREPGTVFHLHGCINQPSSMIVTTSDYLKHYNNKYVRDFLTSLFDEYVVLFVGYGLEETEILEYVLSKGETTKADERKRFLLQGFYNHQTKVFDGLYEYFKECFGVRLLGFSLEHHRHDQLELIVKDWAGQIIPRRAPLSGDVGFIEEVLDGQS